MWGCFVLKGDLGDRTRAMRPSYHDSDTVLLLEVGVANPKYVPVLKVTPELRCAAPPPLASPPDPARGAFLEILRYLYMLNIG